ncbi:MAG TPA: IPT/TIG domain-containing protein, partial [Opitutus sp.]|nr:IPT/TIG domain-containing protein [Opitutus sp.]
PSRGAQGDRVAINGAHFSPVPADNNVSFNGAVAVVQSATENQLVVLVPNLASSGDVTVTIAGKKSNGVRFDFLSVGINNGSFEDGTLRAFTLEGSGRVVESWKRVTPTDRQFMAFLDTMADPRDGMSTLTSDAFEVPEGMQTLLFDYNLVATALLRPAAEVLEFYIVTDSATIKVDDLFANVALDIHSPISGFDRGSGFRTAGVLVETWAGTGERVQVRIVLKGRGALPDHIPGMRRYDHNPMGLGNNPGTGVFLDNFRLSSGYEPALPAPDPATLSIVSNGVAVTLSSAPGAFPADARVYIWEIATGSVHAIDVGEDGEFTLTVPFSEHARSAHFLISYATSADDESGGRMFSPQLKLGVTR